jgi:nucleotide-binding universal stress UspA family protein
MPVHRIAVGVDGSAVTQAALTWAVRLAAQRSAAVLVVTAWPDSARAVSRVRGSLRPDRLGLLSRQQAQIDTATAGLRRPPRILRELVLSEPVTALHRAAALADVVVVGATWPAHPGPENLTGQLRARLDTDRLAGRPVPTVVVVTVGRPIERPPVAGFLEPAAGRSGPG